MSRGTVGNHRGARTWTVLSMTADRASVQRTIQAVWQMDSAKIIAKLARIVRDVGVAEELAQDALVVALEQWPASGIPDNPAAWLMTIAKNRAIDQYRRSRLMERKSAVMRDDLDPLYDSATQLERAVDEDIADDLLRLMFVACHPVLSAEARVALTLRLLGGLTTSEIARAFLMSDAA